MTPRRPPRTDGPPSAVSASEAVDGEALGRQLVPVVVRVGRRRRAAAAWRFVGRHGAAARAARATTASRRRRGVHLVGRSRRPLARDGRRRAPRDPSRRLQAALSASSPTSGAPSIARPRSAFPRASGRDACVCPEAGERRVARRRRWLSGNRGRRAASLLSHFGQNRARRVRDAARPGARASETQLLDRPRLRRGDALLDDGNGTRVGTVGRAASSRALRAACGSASFFACDAKSVVGRRRTAREAGRGARSSCLYKVLKCGLGLLEIAARLELRVRIDVGDDAFGGHVEGVRSSYLEPALWRRPRRRRPPRRRPPRASSTWRRGRDVRVGPFFVRRGRRGGQIAANALARAHGDEGGGRWSAPSSASDSGLGLADARLRGARRRPRRRDSRAPSPGTTAFAGLLRLRRPRGLSCVSSQRGLATRRPCAAGETRRLRETTRWRRGGHDSAARTETRRCGAVHFIPNEAPRRGAGFGQSRQKGPCASSCTARAASASSPSAAAPKRAPPRRTRRRRCSSEHRPLGGGGLVDALVTAEGLGLPAKRRRSRGGACRLRLVVFFVAASRRTAARRVPLSDLWTQEPSSSRTMRTRRMSLPVEVDGVGHAVPQCVWFSATIVNQRGRLEVAVDASKMPTPVHAVLLIKRKSRRPCSRFFSGNSPYLHSVC